jgi:hypothetical protein
MQPFDRTDQLIATALNAHELSLAEIGGVSGGENGCVQECVSEGRGNEQVCKAMCEGE